MGTYGKVTLAETEVRIKKLLGQKRIPYDSLTRAYRQLEQARGSVG